MNIEVCGGVHVQEMDKQVKAPLSNAKSTRDARLALEINGKFAVKTGQSRISVPLFKFRFWSQMIKNNHATALPDSESVFVWNLQFYDGAGIT